MSLDIYAPSYDEGYKEGYNAGYEKGYDVGLAVGKKFYCDEQHIVKPLNEGTTRNIQKGNATTKLRPTSNPPAPTPINKKGGDINEFS